MDRLEPPPIEPPETDCLPPIELLPADGDVCVDMDPRPFAGMVWVAVAPRFAEFHPAFPSGLLLAEDGRNTGFSTVPCWTTPEEMWSSFPNVLRGTPRPAESLRKTKESLSLRLETTSGF
jgi:hypothetical protein